MSLFDEHKAERRARIQRAARQLVAERGYDGLTMRDLANAARVSVPTLYNLFGSKDAILIAELESMVGTVRAFLQAPSGSFFARCFAAFDAGMRLIEQSPEFFRAVTRMFLTSRDSAPMRNRADAGFVAILRDNLAAAKASGQLADWADPETVATHALALYNSWYLRWAMGEMDLASFRAAASSGMAHVLLGVARGAYADEVLAALRSLPPVSVAPTQEVPDAKSHD